LFVEEAIEHGKFFTLKFKNFDDEREAGVFTGRDIYVKERDVVELPEGSYFVHDIIDSKVFKANEEIGVAVDFLQAPGNDVIVLIGKKDKEILIPFVLEFIEKFDPENKILVFKENIVYDDED